MRFLYLLLLICTPIFATDGCFPGDTHLCHSGHPLFVGGRIQPLVREGEFLDPFWNNEGRRFVLLRPPGKNRLHGILNGNRGVIRIGERSCSDRTDVHCPVPTSDMPCGITPPDISGSAPLVFSDLTSTSVNVSWAVLDRFARQRDPPISWYTLRFREDVETSFGFEEITISGPPTNTFQNLEPDTVYEFQLVPKSVDYGEVIQPTRVQTVRTRCGATPKPSFSKSATTSRSATFTIGIPFPGEWKCSDIEVTLQVQVDGIWEDIMILNHSDTTVVVEGLTPCSSYSYRLKLSNIHEDTFSEVQDIVTDAEGHVGVIQPAGEITESRAIEVSWIPPNMSDNACDVSHYAIGYSFVRYNPCPGDDHPVETEGHVTHHSQVTVSGIETSALLSDLQHFADYEVSITPLVEGRGGAIQGETVSFVASTATAVPPKPFLSKSATTSRSVTFNAGIPVPGTWKCSDMNMTFQVQVDGSWEDRMILNISDTTVVAEDLTPCSSYSYRVKLSNIHEDSFSEVQEVLTDAEGHGGVIQPTSKSTEPGLTQVSWMPPNMSDNACDVSHYLIEYSFVRYNPCPEDDQPVDTEGHVTHQSQVTVPGRETTALLSDLQYFADYAVSITPLVDGDDGAIQGEAVSFVASTATAVPPKPFFSKMATSSRSVTFNVGIPVPGEWKCSDMNMTLQVQVDGTWEDRMILNISDTTVVVEDLTPCSSYSYRLKLSNIHEDSFSEVQEIVTNAEGHGGVTQPTDESTEPGTVEVSWMPPDMSDNACDVDGYVIEYSFVRYKACADDDPPVEMEGHSSHQVKVSGKETSVLLSDLKHFADYEVSITPLVRGPEGPIQGETVTFVTSTTTAEPSVIPGGILLTGVSGSHLTFTWDAPPAQCVSWNGILTGYSYILEKGSEVVRTGTTETTSVEIGDLSPDTEYTFRVAAMTAAGPGPYTKPISEATRFTGCRERPNMRLGGTLSGDRPPWGSGQPIFLTPHHLLFRRGRHFGFPFGGQGGVIKIWRSDRPPVCQGSSRSGNCPVVQETPREIPGFCSEAESPDYSCEATYPRFSYERGDVITIRRLSGGDVKVSWRDWEVAKDKGLGPVTGYLLRYRLTGEATKEIYKGLSLHHIFPDGAVNTNYEFEVVALKEGAERKIVPKYKEEDIPLEVTYSSATRCKEPEFDPVQDLTVVTDNKRNTLIASWSPPPGHCPIVRYECSKILLALKACPNPMEYGDTITELLGDRLATNETTLVLDEDWGWPLADFATYNISVTPITEMAGDSGGGTQELEGETTSIIGTTIANEPSGAPNDIYQVHKTRVSAKMTWGEVACYQRNGVIEGYRYTYFKDGVFKSGQTADREVTVDGLEPGSTYLFKVQARTSVGFGPFSYEKYMITLP